MSQSDYIKRKTIIAKVATKNDTPLNREDNPQILSSQFLTDIKEYEAVNTIINTVPRFNELTPPNQMHIYDMYSNTMSAKCMRYRKCNNDKYNSDTLPNVVPVKTFFDTTTKLPFVTPKPIYNLQYKKNSKLPNPDLGNSTCLQCIGRSKYANITCKCNKNIIYKKPVINNGY